MTDPNVTYAVNVGRLPPRALQLLRFTGREAISELYRFDMVVATSLPAPILRHVALGQRAHLSMRVNGKHRAVSGIIARIRQDGTQVAHAGGAHDVHRFHLTLVPRAWLLRHRKGSHIFQDKRVNEVIDEVAERLHVHTHWDLREPFPERPYCTQFEETDFELMTRLCAENGIWFRFEQPHGGPLDELLGAALDVAAQALPPLPIPDLGGLLPTLPVGEEKMVFSNHASYPHVHDLDMTAMGAVLHFQDASGALAGGHEQFVTEASLTESVRPNNSIYREYDPLRPLAEIEARSGAERGPSSGHLAESAAGLATGLLAGDAPAAIDAGLEMLGELGLEEALSGSMEGLEIYEHDGNDLYPDWERKRHEPELILAQYRRRRIVLEGKSHAVRLEPGRRFRLEGHPLHAANGGHAIVAVEHEGVAAFHEVEGAQPYVNRFTCVPDTVAHVPARPRRRSVQVCMTALVVGPEGEEIHVNERGEIKVKFYWDRRDERHEPTCWIRTMHPWAGANWGHQFIPRVGMEVVVAFLGGDPDMPLVIGSVYNGILPPPYLLPGHKTQSGIRTRSTPNGSGFNELMFEDAAGRELVHLRAERDQHNLVQHDRRAVIGHRDRTEVGENQHLEVMGEQHVRIHRDRRVDLRESDTIHVHGNRHLEVDDQLEQRLGRRSLHVRHGDRREIHGSSQTIVHGGLVTMAKGSATLLVGQSEAPKNGTVHVEGTLNASAMESIDIASDQNITLRVGSSFIRISDGHIQLSADAVTVQGEDAQLRTADGEIRLNSSGNIQAVSDDAIVMQASGAALGLRSEASLEGARVLLNSPEQANDSVETSTTEPLELEVVDQEGTPLAYARYVIELDGGGGVMGHLDAEGKARVNIEGSGRVTFPDLAEVEQA